jgi:hypothetical protein
MIECDVTSLHPFIDRPFDTNRADGVHLTDILRLMREDWLNEIFPDADTLTDEERLKQRLNWAAGFIWEDALSHAMNWPYRQRWKDVCIDGIYLNPDNRCMVDDGFIHEFKFTKQSANKRPSMIQHWMWQNKCYAYAMSTPDVVYGGRFHVLYINGDYRTTREPVYKVYEYEYCYQELLEQWMAVINFAKGKGMIQ